MRLTVDVILHAKPSINPLRERELDLRGYKAPAIENLGVTKDSFDCFDLSDNEIKKLENFPRLQRLRMLLLNNNHISRIQDNLAESIANLEYLVLTGNRISNFSELDRLMCFKKLDTLSLCGNPVTKRKYYREYVINKLPQLRVLDFQKIRPRDREAATMLFNSMVGKRLEQEAGAEYAIESRQGEATLMTNGPKRNRPQVEKPVEDVSTHHANLKKQQRNELHLSRASNVPNSTEDNDVVMEEPAAKETREGVSMKEALEPSPKKPKTNEAGFSTPVKPQKPVEQMTVTILREQLKKRGLSTAGLKADLVKRLKEAIEVE